MSDERDYTEHDLMGEPRDSRERLHQIKYLDAAISDIQAVIGDLQSELDELDSKLDALTAERDRLEDEEFSATHWRK